MISQIRGSVQIKSESEVVIWANGIGYEILVPMTVMKSLLKKTNDELQDTALVTFHYYENNQSRIMPRLIGFGNKVEREFFELFITVANMGPKTAVRALSQSFHSIAEAIEEADYKTLSSLPGIGEKKAKQIIATLQGKAGKFALIKDEDFVSEKASRDDIVVEAVEVLLQLGYRRAEAQSMVKRASEMAPESPKTSEELIQLVYELKLMK